MYVFFLAPSFLPSVLNVRLLELQRFLAPQFLRELQAVLCPLRPSSFQVMRRLPVEPLHVQFHSNLKLNILSELLSGRSVRVLIMICMPVQWVAQVADAVAMGGLSAEENGYRN